MSTGMNVPKVLIPTILRNITRTNAPMGTTEHDPVNGLSINGQTKEREFQQERFRDFPAEDRC